MTRRVLFGLALLGLAIAGYLSIVHATSGTAICPAGGGGCEAVQNSPKLKILGVYIPYFAVAGYAAILVALALRSMLAVFLIAVLGIALTGYVTYLQAFEIDAWCTWCIASTVLMWLIAGLSAREYLRGPPPASATAQ